MFMGCTGLTKLDLPSEEQGHYFGTYANNFTECFYRCSSLQTLTLNGDFGKYATDLTGMFVMCSSLYSIDIGSGFGSAATRCISLFDSCESLLNIKFNPNFCQNATDISHMFYCCLKLTQIDFGTNPKIGQSVRFCNCMFQGCYNLRTIDLSSFVVNEDVSCGDMLNNCGSLESFRISDS
ncbi:MAG: leucine-rich repeat protein [Coriobacteriia bacterium]|nr:leucine-rich repeat protein [Coriobacteriia bacterium]